MLFCDIYFGCRAQKGLFFPMPRSDKYSFKSSSYSCMCMCMYVCVVAHVYAQRLTLSVVPQSLTI